MAEQENRFAHIFTSIKDLAKIWNVDIPQELQQYMQDIEELLNQEEYGKINFAEAAMLIQGSTNVYSRRVEALYDLVFGVLENIVQNRKKGDKTKTKSKMSFLNGELDGDMVMIVDHLIKKGKSIDQEDTGNEEPLLHRRIPLWLLPREESDRRKNEFKVNGCFIDASGAFLLSESAMMLDLQDEDEVYEGKYDRDYFLRNPPVIPANVEDYNDCHMEDDAHDDKQLIGLTDARKKEMEERDRQQEDRINALRTNPKTPMTIGTVGRPATPGMQSVTFAAGHEIAANVYNPFERLEPHELIGNKQPLMCKDMSRAPPQALLMSYKELMKMERAVDEDRLDAIYFDNDPSAVQTTVGAYLPINQDLFFHTVPHKPKLLAPRMGYSTSMLQYEGHLQKQAQAAQEERREHMKKKKILNKTVTEAIDFEVDPMQEQFPEEPEPDSDHDAVENEPWAEHLDTDVAQLTEPQRERMELRRQQVAQLEAQIEQAQNSYKQVVKKNMETHASDSSTRMTGIFNKVRKWQETLLPVLAEEETHREFDFQLYGLELLGNMSQKTETDEATETQFPFFEICEGLPRYEVCRMFLTSLFLTNQGNIDIEYSNNDEIFRFILHLLSASKNFDALGDEEGRAFARAIKARNTRKKQAEPQPVVDDASAKQKRKPGKKQREDESSPKRKKVA